MNCMVWAVIVAMIATLISGKSFADIEQCFAAGITEQLYARCITDVANNKLLPEDEVKSIDVALKNIGFSNGLGLNFSEQSSHDLINITAQPVLRFESNINNGNPQKDLIIGQIKLEGEADRVKKAGSVAGYELNLGGRWYTSEGSYLNYRFQFERVHASNSNDKILSDKFHLCSENHIYNWTFLSLCSQYETQTKTFNKFKARNYNVNIVKAISLKSGLNTAFSLGINHLKQQDYDQQQFTIGLETMTPNKSLLKANIKIGDPVENMHSLKYQGSIHYNFKYNENPISLSLRVSHLNGSKWFGLPRDDKSWGIAFSFPLTSKFLLSLGYDSNQSTLDYFSNQSPTVALHYSLLELR